MSAAIFLISLPAFAANLSVEVPLGTVALQPAPYFQEISGLASNGTSFLATWTDGRTEPGASGPIRGYAVALDGNGNPATATDIKLPLPAGPLAWNGSAYVTAMADGTSVFLQPLDPNGRVAGGRIPLDLTALPREIASNGRTVLTVDDAGLLLLASLDGGRIKRQSLSDVNAGISNIVVLADGDYALVLSPNGGYPGDMIPATALVIVDGATGAVSSRDLLFVPAATRPSLASAGDALVVAWSEATGPGGIRSLPKFAIVDRGGNVLAPPALIDEARLTSQSGGVLAAGSDGRDFLIAVNWRVPNVANDALRAYHVLVSGQVAGLGGTELASASTRGMRFATSDDGVAAAWDEQLPRDGNFHAVARAARDIDAFLAAPTQVIAKAATVQAWPRLAAGGAFAVWVDGWPGEIALQATGGSQQFISDRAADTAPAVTRGASSYLVVWTVSSGANATIEAKRVAFDGTPIDSAPIVIGAGQVNSPIVPAPAVAFDGTNFLVVWADLTSVIGARLSQSGVLLESTPIPIIAGYAPDDSVVLSVVWTGSEYVVGSLEQFIYGTEKPFPQPALLRVARVTALGSVLDPKPVFLWQNGSAPTGESLSLAAADGAVTVLWTGGADSLFHDRCVYAMQLRNDATPAADARPLQCTSLGSSMIVLTDAGLAWNGSEFVAVWTDVQRTVVAQRFDRSMMAIDPQPFAVSPEGAIAAEATVVATANGTAIAYVRIADEPQYGGVSRAFVRMLQPLGAPARAHAARH